jgi:hypothetical protein
MNHDLGQIVHRMERRKTDASKSSLKNELLQWRDALEVKRRIPDWKQFLSEQLGLRKSSLFGGIQVYREFGALLLHPVDGEGDDAFDVPCEYATIPVSSLKLLLKVAKGCSDEFKEVWLTEAAALSFSDLRKLIAEKEGRPVCDCTGKPVEKIVWCCPDCGKRVKVNEEEESGEANATVKTRHG